MERSENTTKQRTYLQKGNDHSKIFNTFKHFPNVFFIKKFTKIPVRILTGTKLLTALYIH